MFRKVIIHLSTKLLTNCFSDSGVSLACCSNSENCANNLDDSHCDVITDNRLLLIKMLPF